MGVADAEPKLIGKSINMMLTPLPVRKRVRKFTHEEEVLEEMEEEKDSPETEPSGSDLNGQK
jgi:translation initiation factor IF-3